MSYRTTPSEGIKIEGIDLHGPVHFLQKPGGGINGISYRYLFTTVTDAMALYKASMHLHRQTEIQHVDEHLYDIHEYYNQRWVFPFVRSRALRGKTVIFTLDRHPLPHSDTALKKVVCNYLLGLQQRRLRYSEALLDWTKPPLEPTEYLAGQPLHSVPTLLKELWAKHGNGCQL